MSLSWYEVKQGDVILYRYNNDTYPEHCPAGYYIAEFTNREPVHDGFTITEKFYFGSGVPDLGDIFFRNENITDDPSIWFNPDGNIIVEMMGVYKKFDDAIKYVTEHFPEYAI
ncbi:hypothetical protein [Vibrio phage phiKT1024]|nr:hypothetical protein [Vibrio phage phiKT1024]